MSHSKTVLIQIHHQFIERGKTIKTEFCGQNEIGSHDELREWGAEIAERFPLPDGAVWLFCREPSRWFIKTEAAL